MISTIFSEWILLWWNVLVLGAVTAPGEMLFGPEKQTIYSRLRWALFWSFTLLVQAASVWVFGQLVRRFGVEPLLVIDLSSTGEAWHPVVRTVFLAFLTLVSAFIYDFTYYWFHRMQHAIPFLWRFHAVHHSIEELNCMNCGHHWTEGFLHCVFILLPLFVLFDLRFEEVFVIAVMVVAWTQFVHANSAIEFGNMRWILVSPRFHRLHHSLASEHFDQNFAGVFSIIDMAFGTGKFPKPGERICVGLSDKREPSTLREFLFALCDKS